jgi:hypothetical protein
MLKKLAMRSTTCDARGKGRVCGEEKPLYIVLAQPSQSTYPSRL